MRCLSEGAEVAKIPIVRPRRSKAEVQQEFESAFQAEMGAAKAEWEAETEEHERAARASR
jgi:hypothetical protein